MKLHILVACLVAMCWTYSSAQKVDWNSGGGSWVDDFVGSVTVDKKGNVYTTGKMGSWGTMFGVDIEEWAFYVVKQNRQGATKWVRFNTGNSYDAKGDDVAVDSEGNVYVVGSFHYDMDFGDTTIQGGASGILSTMFFVKYDSLGNRKWLRSFGNDGHAGLGYLAIDKDDNVYVGGSYWDNLDLGSNVKITTEHPYYFPSADAFVSRWTTDGKPVWARSFSTSNDNYLVGLQTDPGGNIHLAGNYANPDLLSGSYQYTLPQNYGSTFLASCDALGNVLKVIPTDEVVTDMTIDNSGNIYVAGSMDFATYYASKIKPDYTTDWIKAFTTGSAFSSVSPRIAVANGNVFLGAVHFGGLSIDSLTISNGTGMSVSKISDLGAVQWTRDFPVRSYDRVNGLAAAETGRSINFGGYYADYTLDLGGHVITNNSGNDDGDVFVAQLRDTTTTKCPARTAKLAVAREELCEGESIPLQPNFGASSFTVKWLLNDAPVATSRAFTANITGDYRYVRYPGTVCADTSNILHITVLDYPSKVITPVNVTGCNSDALVSVSEDENYTYKWYRNKVLIQGETSSSLVATQDGMYYSYISNGGLCTTKTDSAIVKLYVKPAFDISSSQVTPGKIKYSVSSAANIDTYNWSVTGTQLSSINPDPTFAFTSLGDFEVCVTASNPGCETTMCVPQAIACPERSSILSVDITKLCEGDSTLLRTNLEDGSSETLDWYLDDDLVASKNTLYAEAGGDYRFIRYSGTICADTSNVATVHFFVSPQFTIGVMPLQWNEMQYSVSNTNNIDSYAWTVTGDDNVNPLMTSADASPTFTFTDEASLEICVVASNAACEVQKCVDQVITGLENSSSHFRLFPNPFNDNLGIVGDDSQDFRVDVFDSSGRSIVSRSFTKSFEIGTRTWPGGIYFVVVATDGMVETVKVVKR